MIRFECDYAEGAHPKILEKLCQTNEEQTPGYGLDPHCDAARALICRWCGDETLDVHFLVGGTQANATVIASILRPHQGVIAATTGHINAHETGAIEATGHKVIAVPCGAKGKLTAAQIEAVHAAHWSDTTHEHIVQPAMVYISQSTENGAIYSKRELEALSEVCRARNLPLYLDGARLGYALAAEENDLAPEDLARLCDVFYIGGTKVGALFGEAVVIANDALKRDFRYHIKQRGGMLAKGRLLGIQFETLFTDGLYLSISRHAVEMARRIKAAFAAKGYPFLCDSPTNQQFPILPNTALDKLREKYAFSIWAKIDEETTAVRFCTSWATKEADVEALCKTIAVL